VLARELGPRKIRVNTINPGMVETEATVGAGFIGSDFEKAIVPKFLLDVPAELRTLRRWPSSSPPTIRLG